MKFELKRRRFGQLVILGTLMAALGDFAKKIWAQTRPELETRSIKTFSTTEIKLRINSTPYSLKIEPRVTLLDMLRERIGLTGTKKGCDHGQCGACTVIADGRRINSCLALAMQYEGSEITTVEGLVEGEELHPIQTAFIANDGFQCGYCTSGQICSAVALLDEFAAGEASFVTANLSDLNTPRELTDDEIRERMSGNLCRCGAYPGIVAAVREYNQQAQI